MQNRKRRFYFLTVFGLSVLVNYLDFYTTELCLGVGRIIRGSLYEKNTWSIFLFDRGTGRFSIVSIQVYVMILVVAALVYALHVHHRALDRVGDRWYLRVLNLISIGYPFTIIFSKSFISMSNYLLACHCSDSMNCRILTDPAKLWYEQVLNTSNGIQSAGVLVFSLLGWIIGILYYFRDWIQEPVTRSCQQPVDNFVESGR